MFEILSDRFIYIPIIILLMTGLYVVVATGNLVKRLVGLSLFQTSVCLLYIAIGKVFGGAPPILPEAHGEDAGHAVEPVVAAVDGHAQSLEIAAADHGAQLADHATELAANLAPHLAPHLAPVAIYSNPLPHVLILTAIVVGVATLAVGLALVIRIQEAYGTIEDDDLNSADYAVETGGGE